VLKNSAELFLNNTMFFGWQLMIIYVISAILFQIKYRKESIINPEFFISIIFFFCTFLYYPLLYNSPINNFIFGLLSYVNDEDLIKSQSIAVMSFLFYLLGASLINKKKFIVLHTNKEKYSNKIFIEKRMIFHIITSFLIILSMLEGGYKIIYRYKDGDVDLNEIGVLFSYITIFLLISSILEILYLRQKKSFTLKEIFRNINILYFFNILFMASLYLVSGYRSAVFPILIPLIYLIDIYLKKINRIFLIVFFFIALIIMSFIKDIRKGNEVSISKENFKLEYIGGDFTSANEAMYFLINYTDRHGSQQGQNALMQMVSFIPFAQSLLINNLGFNPTDNSSVFFTDSIGVGYGLGTHVIGDLYYTFGFLGSLFWMFILGVFTNFLYIKVVRNNSIKIWEITVYLLILGNSIMFSRVEFFFLVRNIGFSIIILWLFEKIFTINRRFY